MTLTLHAGRCRGEELILRIGVDSVADVRCSLSLGCISLLTGCSFVFSQGPPRNHERLVYFDCVSSGAAPATDLVNALASGLGAIGSAHDDSGTAANESDATAAWTYGAAAALSAASAIYGFSSTWSCRSAKEQLKEQLKVRWAAAKAPPSRRVEKELPKAQPVFGCSRDLDCKGERICVNQSCTDAPTPEASPAPPPEEPTIRAFPEVPSDVIPAEPEGPATP